MRRVLPILFACAFALIHANTKATETGTEPDGYIGGYGYVDLGLPSGTLWAVHNIGAENEYECGDYFAWGETETKDYFSWENYKYFIGEVNDEGWIPIELEDIGYQISGTEYDVANVKWGNGWVMPDSIQLREMWAHTFTKRVEENGTEGVRAYSTKHEGKSIFFGDFGIGECDEVYTGGIYWGGTSQISFGGSYETPTNAAITIETQKHSPTIGWNSRAAKFVGACVRPVIKKGSLIDKIESESGLRVVSLYQKIIKLNCNVNKGSLSVYNPSGRVVIKGTFTGSEIALDGISPGVYILSISDDNGSVITKKLNVK